MATTQITRDGVTKDIHDRRLPTTLGTAGQVLKMNDDANAIVWGESGGGGGHLYQHNITARGVYNSKYSFCATSIITSDATPMTTMDVIANWLLTNGFDNRDNVYPASGSFYYSDTVKVNAVYGMWAYNTNAYAVGTYADHSGTVQLNIGNLPYGTIVDRVVQLL